MGTFYVPISYAQKRLKLTWSYLAATRKIRGVRSTFDSYQIKTRVKRRLDPFIRAVLGGWDPSARKFFNTDELTFTVPYDMFEQMVKRFGESFLTTKTWATVQKKIARSNQAWARKTERRDIQ